MANEIAITFNFQALKTATYRAVRLFYGSWTRDWTGSKYYGPIIQTLSTAYEAISKGDVGTVREVVIRNVNASANIIVSRDSGVTDHDAIPPGQVQFFYPSDITTIRVKASAGTPDMELTVIEA